MKTHSFHIPVLGIGYSIDTPLKVAKYGMDSVISLVDDVLLEKIRKMYCNKYELPYNEISERISDFRAKRITSYLNLINKLTEKKFDEFKNVTLEKAAEIKQYFNMLPESSAIKHEFERLTSKFFKLEEIKSWVNDNLSIGSIDVNIMTKIDKDNYEKGNKLPVEFNDAHAALRGYANSNLKSSIILSAGMNPRLYGYFEQFDDFFPNKNGEIKKKIILKVSDYRSALIQGRFLAKKGLWISEYRIESGLNCGGHAFATDGYLLGTILAEFKDNREELRKSVFEILKKSLADKNRIVPENDLSLKVTAQGGVGTSEEHDFLIEHYKIDSVGWGSPFLLVPEATSIDEPTINALIDAKEDDLLSNISPLGVPFNSLKGNTKDIEKISLIDKGNPGSICPKNYLAFNNEFTSKTICTASRQYQRKKIKELDQLDLSKDEYNQKHNEIVDKSCLCVGLGTSALLANNIDTKKEGPGVSVCPGPNMAYFSKKMTLKEITDHIYGRKNVIDRADRPNMLIKELWIYIDYLKNKIDEAKATMTVKQEKHFLTFTKNLKEGVAYYQSMFSGLKDSFSEKKSNILSDLEKSKDILNKLYSEIQKQTNILF